MYAVMVEKKARKSVTEKGLIWVDSESGPSYVSKKERGLWDTLDQAREVITEPWEIVVEV